MGKRRLVVLSALVVVLLLGGCRTLAQQESEPVLNEETVIALTEQLEERIAYTEKLVKEFDEKIELLESANQEFDAYVKELSAAKEQSVSLMLAHTTSYKNQIDEKQHELEQNMVNMGERTNMTLQAIQYEFNKFKNNLSTAEKEFQALVSTREQIMDNKILGTQSSLQTEMRERFSLLEQNITGMSMRLNEFSKEFNQLKEALTLFTQAK